MHYKLLGFALLLVSSGILGALITRGLASGGVPELPQVDEIPFANNAGMALQEDRLIPPPAAPPSIFTESDRPALVSADRDWNKLEPSFRNSVLRLLLRLNARGYRFVLIEGYRSPARQDELADGAGNRTAARAFQSQHQFGRAADLAPLRDAKLAFDMSDEWTRNAYAALGEEARGARLEWGGDWRLQDYGHIEMKK